ncbi:UNVERIFIED_CONTAM: hypothetical protein GTU68_004892 [Idotea baltica]|nr:hypothetical protein [Idotea baltica]
MKLLLVLCLVGVAFALPQKKYGNPDEWGSYYQGDIRLPLPSAKNGILDESYRWDGGVVPYEWSDSFDEGKKATVIQAMDSYADLTGGCITFVERTTESSYVSYVDADDGCWSYVGRQGGMQEINYPQWCIDQYGSVQHEMYHALGFFHEQSRTDRDDYVTIEWDNIEDGQFSSNSHSPQSLVFVMLEKYFYYFYLGLYM